MKRTLMKRIIAFLLCLMPFTIIAQDEEFTASLQSPFHTMKTHLYFLQNDSYEPEKASKVIPPGVKINEKRIEYAKKLKQILDGKGLYVYLNTIPKNSNYRDSVSQLSIYTPFPVEMPEVYLEKIQGNWYYSQDVIDNLPAIYSDIFPFGADFLADYIPEWGHEMFLGTKAYKWLGVLLLLLIGYLVHKLFTILLIPIIKRILRKSKSFINVEDETINGIARSISQISVLWVILKLYPSLQLPVRWSEWVNTALLIIMAVFIGVLLYRLSKLITNYLDNVFMKTENKMDDQLLPIIERLFKVVIIIAIVFYVLSLLHVNVTALIAGLSIGGLALALAAQDTVKNLIGSVMIFLDRPFQIGDFVNINGEYGTITEVGFRSTRFQTVDTSLISIPNGKLADMMVKNMGVRVLRLFDTTIGIALDTPPDLVEEYIARLKELIEAHPTMLNEDYMVVLNDINPPALKIFLRAYIDVRNYDEELAVKEELFLGIIKIAEEMNIDLPYPSTRLYVESLPGQEREAPAYKQGVTDEIKAKTNQQLDKLREKYKKQDEYLKNKNNP